MRRLPDDQRGLVEGLLSLSPPYRLFVQRWIELFDRDGMYFDRARPVSRGYVEAELRDHERRDFHVPIMEEELNAIPSVSWTDLEPEDIIRDPLTAAERLASGLLSAGFHPSFLYHAFKALLWPPDVPFEERLAGLLRWWSNNAKARGIAVIFRTVSGGMSPASDSICSLIRWPDLPEKLRSSVRRDSGWWREHGKYAEANGYFLLVKTSTLDADNATGLALEIYERYRLTAVNLRNKPISVDTWWVLVHDPEEAPSGSTHAFRYHPYRFPLPPPLERTALQDLSTLEHRDENVGRLRDAYSRALDDIRHGRFHDALPDLSQGVELALAGYRPTAGEVLWGSPRLFVEKASLVLALDWPYQYFKHFMTYALSPSYLIEGECLVGDERRPEVILRMVTDDSSWQGLAARAPWDDLLNWKRQTLCGIRASCSNTIRHAHRVTRWDLARAVRARNALLHQGQPVRDAYLIAIVLHALETMLQVTLLAYREGSNLTDVLQAAERCFDKSLRTGVIAGDDMAFGWRKMRRRVGRGAAKGTDGTQRDQ